MLCYSTGTYVASALDVKDCLALMAGRSKISTLLWEWVKLREPVTTVGDTGDVSNVPILTILQECPKCRLRAFKDNLVVEWVESSLETADVFAYLEEAKATLLCSQKCRTDAREGLETLANANWMRFSRFLMRTPRRPRDEARRRG